jgi:hypothetical protein
MISGMLTDLQYFQVAFCARYSSLNGKHAQYVLHICRRHYFIVEQHLYPTQSHVDLEIKLNYQENS